MKNQFVLLRARCKAGKSKLASAGVVLGSVVASQSAFAIDETVSTWMTDQAAEAATYTPYMLGIALAILSVSAAIGWTKKFGSKAVS